MITYIHGGQSGNFSAGDIVFLAGNPFHPDPPFFEHAAVSAGELTMVDPSDLLHLKIYGLPESEDSSIDLSLLTEDEVALYGVNRYSNYFRQPDGSENRVGHPETAWNLACRVPVSSARSDAVALQAALETGRRGYRYATHFRVKIDGDGTRHTNCLGFVCDLFERFGEVRLLSPTFPPYSLKRAKKCTRDYPSVGHLAHALNGENVQFPYGEGFSEAEAEATALAKSLLLGLVGLDKELN